METDFTETSLNLAIAESVYALKTSAFKDLLARLFGQNVETISAVLKTLIHRKFINQLKGLVRHLGKKHIYQQLKNGSSKFIKDFTEASNANNLKGMFSGVPEIEEKLNILIEEKSEGNLLAEFGRYFQRFKNRFAPAQAEEAFQVELYDWFKSGEMTLQIWDCLNSWYQNGASLGHFRFLTIPKPTSRDSFYSRTIEAAKKIGTDEFLNPEKIKTILETFLVKPSWKLEGKKLVISGSLIYFSREIGALDSYVKDNEVEQVEFYAADCFHLDSDVKLPGLNFTVTGNKAYIWGKRKIDLSGKGFETNKSKAKNAASSTEKGQDGKDGLPGGSSGNLTMLVREMVYPSDLTVHLVGGRGEDGQDGGDGFDGPNGVGVTQSELDELCVKYKSLYWGFWSTFHDYTPPGNWENTYRKWDYDNQYGYEIYKDEHGRKIRYSYAGFKEHWYEARTYDLYFAVIGSLGKKGTQGGSNGVGGEGGYLGNARVENPETGECYPVTVIKKLGENGTNGACGKSGKYGINGNDMVMIDRSETGGSKFYYGLNEKSELSFGSQYSQQKYNRFNGDMKYVDGKSACFVTFSTSDINRAVVTAENASERTERTSRSKAVAKKSVISEELLAKANNFFENESKFLADACEETALAAEEDEENEEEQETVTEQVVILRQKNEETITSFTPKSEKRIRPKFTKNSLVGRIQKTGRHGTIGTAFQNMADLFSIEVPFNQLEKIRFQTLFQKNHTFHFINDSKLSCAVIAAQQDAIQNGKSYDEIISFAKDLTVRRRQKFEFSKLTSEVAEVMNELETVDCKIDRKIDATAEKLIGIEKKSVDFGSFKFIDAFFQDFVKFKADGQLLALFNGFLKKIDADSKVLLESLCENVKNGEEFEEHLKKICAWHEDNIKAQQKEDSDDATPPREPNQLELKFSELVEKIMANTEFWNSVFEPLEAKINADGLDKRFGKVPHLDKKSFTDKLKSKWPFSSKDGTGRFSNFFKDDKIVKFVEAAKFVLRFYKDARPTLEFNRHLYFLNWLMKIDQGKEVFSGIFVDDGLPNNFDDFLVKFQARPLNLEDVECQDFMTKHGLGCSSTRYLYAQVTKKQIVTFVKTGYQELKKIEEFNVKNAKETVAFWVDDRQVFGIESDDDYRDLIEAIDQCDKKYVEKVKHELEKLGNEDFTLPENLKQLSSYFDSEYQAAVEEWIEDFVAITGNQKLLSILKKRFFIDGNHLSTYEFQSILLSVAKLQITFRCPLRFLILAICSVPQNEIINVLVYLQILFHRSSRFRDNCKIYNSLQLVDSVKHKSLLVLKMFEYKDTVETHQLYPLILMLQHANSGAEQLENIGLAEWIDIASRQKWSEITGLIRKYGDVGYYLGILDGLGKNKEEKLMRTVFDSVVCIPERLIALITHFIEDGEIVADEDYFAEVKKVLMAGNDFIKFDITDETKLPYLVKDEKEQFELLQHMSKNCPDVNIFPENTRTIDDVARLVFGIHDKTEDEKIRRKEETEKIAELLKILEEAKKSKSKISKVLKKNGKILSEKTCERLQVLADFDEFLHEIKEKYLRHTQKMAILYAVENGKHLLEQVNTGEGKSFIIAAIAIIRKKVDYRYVDVITSSPVLAERDSQEMKPLFHKFGLTIGHNCVENPEERKKAYQCDVVYGDIARFQRDYLLHTFYKKELLGSRVRDCVIVDEVDNMLLDNGNNMLYLSHNIPGLNLLDSLLVFIHSQVHKPMYNGMKKDLEELQASFDNKKIKDAVLTDIFGRLTSDDLKKLASVHMNQKSVESAFEKLVANEIIDLDGFLMIHEMEKVEAVKNLFADEVFKIRLENTLKIILKRKREIVLPHYLKPFVKLHLDEFIKNCKNSMFLGADEEYVVDVDRTGMEGCLEPKVTIIDSNTGADLATSQWNGGLHQFLQLKHGCRLSPISLKAVFISNVAYLKGYEKINGLSGTLGSLHESQTLIDLYDADLIKIPTFQPKCFYEHVAVVSTREDEWYQNLFDEVCDQVLAERSVLIVSESIAAVQKIALELRTRYEKLENPSDEIKRCFGSVKTYQREFEEFVFNEKNPLDPSKLLIATNLAGRGTDIKLSETLINNGGLHVITSFLPSNRRIEEQAFGRAARCGQPGSAQIIALRVDDNGTEQSIFQLKMFRDNQEVHRLTSLKSFYDFHTEIEEQCLEKFRQHCSKALNQVYSSSGANNEEHLPTPSQVVYFALLDKWALWLDEKSSLIDLCAKNPQESEKQSIIESVQEFLGNHPFSSDESCFEVAKKWVDAPQSLITIGIIQMCHENGFKDAEDTFDRILTDGNEFAAEVYYYKACMRMREWQSTRDALSSMKIANPKEFTSDLDEAMQFFHKSRTIFMERISRKQKEGKIIAQLCQNSNQANSSGFSSQQEAIISAYRLIVDNIDWIIGRPISENTFVTEEIGENYGRKIYESFARQGIFSPSLINNQKLEDWQLESLRHTFKLSKADVNKMLEEMKKDSRIEAFDDYYVFNKLIMMAHVKLPHRTGFWTQLNQMEVFNRDLSTAIVLEDETAVETNISTVRKILVVDPSFVPELPSEFEVIEPITLDDDETARYQVRLSNGKAEGIIYDWEDVAALADEALVKKIDKLVSEKKIVWDYAAQINLEAFARIGYCEKFDGVTISEVAEYFEIDKLAAGWILSTLIDFDILKPQIDLFYQFNPDEDVWTKKVGVFLKDETKSDNLIAKNAKVGEFLIYETKSDNLIAEYAEIFDLIRKMPDLKNVSPELIQNACKIEDDKKLVEFYKSLLDEKILVPYRLTRFRLVGKLDCSCLPPSISHEVLKFFNDRFAYSFAVETLSYALNQSETNPKVPKQILLPTDPFKDLEQQLKQLGIVLPSRISTMDYKNLESEDYEKFQLFEAIIHENRTKLFDQTHFHMELGPSAAFFNSREHLMDGETRAIVKNGLPMLIMPKKVSTSWKAATAVVKFVAKVAKAVWSCVKAIGSFFYKAGAAFVKTCVKPLVNKAVAAFDYVAEKAMDVGKSIKEAVCEVADAIAESEIYKAATETVKTVASAVGNAAVAVGEAVATVADKTGVTAAAKAVGNAAVAVGTTVAEAAKTAGTFVADKAGAAADYVASTKVYQMAKDVVNRALDAAKYAYQKLSAYVTSVVESYEYYSECRLGARQLAIEQQGLVDEQAILISFNDANVEQNRKEINDRRFLKKINEHVASESEKFVMEMKQVVEKLIDKDFDDATLECPEEDLEALLSTGQGFRKFRSEVVEHFTVFASIAKVIFYQVIRTYAADDEMNLTVIPVSSISLMGKYDCDKLFETIKDICDEIKEFAGNNNVSDSGKKLNVEELKESTKSNLTKQLDLLASNIYIEPTVKITTEFLANCRNKPQLLSMANFAEKDCELKKALTDYNLSKQSKKNSKALRRALFELFHQSLAANPNNKFLYRVAFKYGYPLPISCAEKLAAIAHQVIVHGGSTTGEGQGYQAGFLLKVFDASQKDFQGEPLVSIPTAETAKMEVRITHAKGMIFLCEPDYQTFVKNGELATEESTTSFLYEAIIGKLKMTAKYFPKHHESFRDAMIHFV